MLPRKRALIVGLAGPAIQVVGFVWTIAHLLLAHLHDPLSPRHIVFEAPFLVILVGLLVSIVGLPVAIEVARASETELDIPIFDPEAGGAGQFDLQPRTSGGK
jgi:NhaP-type Na+/H+ or K+/H+ antiporter